jgi:anti-anti-sigma factor
VTAPALLLRPTGALDDDHCDELRMQLATAFGTGVQSIAVDLSAITHADVTGLQVLAGAARHLRKRGGVLVVTGASRQITSLIRVNGLSDLLDVPLSQPLRVVAGSGEATGPTGRSRELVPVERRLRVIRPEPA